jgi:hypothetical protein
MAVACSAVLLVACSSDGSDGDTVRERDASLPVTWEHDGASFATPEGYAEDPELVGRGADYVVASADGTMLVALSVFEDDADIETLADQASVGVDVRGGENRSVTTKHSVSVPGADEASARTFTHETDLFDPPQRVYDADVIARKGGTVYWLSALTPVEGGDRETLEKIAGSLSID